MKKGFTLVELVSVIVILGILSILIVPKVINSLNDSEEKTNLSSAENLLNAAQYKSANNDIQGTNQTITINYTTGENKDYLDYSGKKPEKGKVKITNDGKIAIAIKIGDYCYKKGYNENEITTIPYSEDTCENNGRFFVSYNIPETVTAGDGLYESTTDPGRLIYRGENPNNYIALKEDGTNNTLYRIVSYEVDGTIKVVRDDKLSSNLAWDRSTTSAENTYCTSPVNGCNAWGNGSNTLYNGEALGDSFHYSYYESPTATTLSNGRSGTVTSESTLNTYLNDTWLPSSLTNYIDNHSWNVGGIYWTIDDKGIMKEKEEEKQLQWIGKVGLLNITEYVEASTNPDCTSVRLNYGSESGSPCKTNNWIMYNKTFLQWTISPYSSTSTHVWVVGNGPFANDTADDIWSSVRPAFFLKADIELIGEGTETNPYRIVGM